MTTEEAEAAALATARDVWNNRAIGADEQHIIARIAQAVHDAASRERLACLAFLRKSGHQSAFNALVMERGL